MSTAYIPTNRYNATAILSSGLHIPASAYDKHYTDLLTLVPGRIVLSTGPISRDIADYLSAEGTSSFPVMIEVQLPPRAKPGSLPGINAGATRYLVPAGVAPITEPKIHFRTQTELEEFTTRIYANFDPATVATVITPRLFEATSPSRAELQSELAGFEKPERPIAPTIAAADALAAAVLMLMHAATDEPTVRIAVKALGTLTKPDQSDPKDTLTAVLSSLVGDKETPALTAVIGAILADPASARQAPATFTASLHGAVPDEPRFDTSIEHAISIIKGDRSRSRFREGGLATARALLLFLLQPEPCDVLQWAAADTGATPADLALAAAFSGAARSHAGLPTQLRGTPALDRLIALALADTVNQAASSPIGRYKARSPKLTGDVRPNDPGYSTITYKAADTSLLERRIAEPGRRGELLRADLALAEARAEALDVATRLGWRDAIVTTIELGGGPPGHEAGQIQLLIRQLNGGIDLVVYGTPPRISTTVDPDRYRERLMEVTTRDLEKHLAADNPPDSGTGQPRLSRVVRPSERGALPGI